MSVRVFITAVFLTTVATAAFAQAPQRQISEPPLPSPETAALQNRVISLLNEAIQREEKEIVLQRQVDDLTRQLTEARKLATTDLPKTTKKD